MRDVVGMKIVLCENMMPGSWFVMAADGDVLATGLGPRLLWHGRAKPADHIRASRSVFEVLSTYARKGGENG